MFKKIKITFLLSIVVAVFVFNAGPVYALSIMVHVPEKYTDVEAGERFYFELEIKYPENPRRKDLRLNYIITDESGETIAQAKYLKAIETQASFMDYIVIPESAKGGLHVINVKVGDYEGLDEEVSASFHVVGSKSAQLKLYFFILLGVIALVGILVIVNIVVSRRE